MGVLAWIVLILAMKKVEFQDMNEMVHKLDVLGRVLG
jgi:hypothetical protein